MPGLVYVGLLAPGLIRNNDQVSLFIIGVVPEVLGDMQQRPKKAREGPIRLRAQIRMQVPILII
jgi:hypothetical protein